MNKNDLRKELILKRSLLKNKKELSRIIVDKIIKLDIYQKSKVIALYKSLSNEVDTSYLINYSLNCGKIVLLPKVCDNDLVFLKISKNTLYIRSNFGVMEPIYNEENIYHGSIDLAIIPGVAFDYDNNRLGYGKGYYDRLLSKNTCYKIGVCFSCQMVNSVYADEHDIQMDLVISEKSY